MNKLYVYLIFNFLFSGNLAAMAAIEPKKNNWHLKLFDNIITEARDQEQIITDSHFNPTLSIQDLQDQTNGVRLTAKAFFEDNSELIDYLLENNIPIMQTPYDLIKLAIKKNSLKIIKILDKHNVFMQVSPKQRENFVLQAIRRRKTSIVEFLLTKFTRINKKDGKYLAAAPNEDMKELLINNDFTMDKSQEQALLNKLKRQTLRKSITDQFDNNNKSFSIADLFENIKFSDNEMVKQILESKSIEDINSHNNEKETVLTLAVISECDTDMIRILASHGADLNLQNGEGFTPLILSIQANNHPLFSTLVDLGADINIQCKDKNGTIGDALVFALRLGHLIIAKALAENPRANRNFMDERKRKTPLTRAILNKQTEMVRTLLAEGLDDFNKALGLITAIQRDRQQYVKMLLQSSADPNYEIENETALAVAVKRKDCAIIKSLLDSKKISQDNISIALWIESQKRLPNVDIINLLLKAGAESNILFRDGMSPLINLAQNGSSKALAALLSNGADINFQNKQGSSALMLAAKNRNLIVVAGLLCFKPTKNTIASKLNINQQDYDGNTALNYAAYSYSPHVIKVLLEHKANLKIHNNNGETTLSILAKLTQKDIFTEVKKMCEKFICDTKNDIDLNVETVKEMNFLDFSSETPLSEKIYAAPATEKDNYASAIIFIGSLQNLPASDIEKASYQEIYTKFYPAYLELFDAILKIDENSETPIGDLKKQFKAKIRNLSTPTQEKRSAANAFKILKSLIKNERDMITSCCSQILESNISSMRHEDKHQLTPVIHAIINKNAAALRAFLPHLSKKEKATACGLAKIHQKSIIQRIIEQDNPSLVKSNKSNHNSSCSIC